MSGLYVTAVHLSKIGHNIKEIRERALESLLTKLKCGYEFDDELVRSKELFTLLLKWFNFDSPDYHRHILDTIWHLLKAPCGTLLLKQIGLKTLLKDLSEIQKKVNFQYMSTVKDIIQYVKKMGIGDHCVRIPRLDMPASLESDLIDVDLTESEANIRRSNVKVGETFRINNPSSLHMWSNLENSSFDLSDRGIKIFLLPWCQLCDSDMQTISLIQNSLRIGQSVNRSGRFFIDILLKDFPPEVFLNRPSIIKEFIGMLNNTELSTISLESLFSLTLALQRRINQLYDLSLRHCKKISYSDTDYDGNPNLDRHLPAYLIHTEKEKMMRNGYSESNNTLKQIPLPIFCLNTMYSVINALGQGTSTVSVKDEKKIVFSMDEINVALSLCFKLGNILHKTVKHAMWEKRHPHKFIQDIIQKTVVLFRSCGDVLDRYRLSFIMSNMTEKLYRVTYLRLLAFCIYLAEWCDYIPIIPSTFTANLNNSLSDVSCSILHPKLHKKLTKVLQNFDTKTPEDKEKTNMYLNAEKICKGFNSTINILQNFKTICDSYQIISIIRESLPALEFHCAENIIAHTLNVLSIKMLKWKLNEHLKKDVREITLSLLAHSCDWVCASTYSKIGDIVFEVLGGSIKSKESVKTYNESSLTFLLDSAIIIEVCSFGLSSDVEQVKSLAKEILQHLLRGKLLMSDVTWRILLEAVIPALPYLHSYAAHDDAFGKSIIKTLDSEIGQCMLIPMVELIRGNLRLLFTKCFTAQMEGSHNLVKLLSRSEGSENLLPKQDCIRPDLLCSALRTITPKNFNIIKTGDPSFYQEGALLQVINLLKIKNIISLTHERIDPSSDEIPGLPELDPSFRRSALAQLAVMLQQPTLHKTFLDNGGRKIVSHFLQASLTSLEYTTFPESAMSCVSILNSLCYVSGSIRSWASEQQDILLNVIRALLLFPSDESFTTSAAQVLCLLSLAKVTVNTCDGVSNDEEMSSDLALPHCIVSRMKLPFKCSSHSKYSSHRRQERKDWLMSDPTISSHLRIHWCVRWYGGVDKIVRWPYIPEQSSDSELFSKTLMMTGSDLSILKATCPIQGCVSALYQVQNASSHAAVNNALDVLTGYVLLVCDSGRGMSDFGSLPMQSTLNRFLTSPPASPKDSLLLLNVTKFLSTFLQSLSQVGCYDPAICLWIFESIIETTRGITSLLQYTPSDSNWTDTHDDLPSQLRQSILNLLKECCILCNNISHENLCDRRSKQSAGLSWGSVIEFLTQCLMKVDMYNFYSLAYVGQIVESLSHLTYTKHHGLSDNDDTQSVLVKNLAHIVNISYIGNGYIGFKGFALVQYSLMTLNHLLKISLENDKRKQFSSEDWMCEDGESVLTGCLLWYKSHHLIIRSLAFKLLSGLSTCKLSAIYLQDRTSDIDGGILEIAANSLIDLTEASLLREQAGILLGNLLAYKTLSFFKNSHADTGADSHSIFNTDFYNKICATITKVCLNESEELFAGDNISLDFYSNRDCLEVAMSKNDIDIPLKLTTSSSPKCSVGLLTAIADVMYNILSHLDEIPEAIHDTEIFRILFRCITLKLPMRESKVCMLTAVCRILYKAINISPGVHSILVDTQDCVSALIDLFGLDYRALRYANTDLSTALSELWKWAFLLVGSLIETNKGFKILWGILSEERAIFLIESILITLTDHSMKDLYPSALYCLVNMLNSHGSFKNDTFCMESILDKTPIPNMHYNHRKTPVADENNDVYKSEDISATSLFPAVPIVHNGRHLNKVKGSVFSEELCMALLNLYKTLHMHKGLNPRGNEYNHDYVASALCSLLGVSLKAKILAADSGFVQQQIEYLIEIQYTLATTAKPMEILKSKNNHPILNHLNWTIQLLCNVMTNCVNAKELCVDGNLIVPLNKLWPWCIATNKLRLNTIQMLCIFTNLCPKATQSMHMTVGSRSILCEVIDLTGKEMNLLCRTRSLATLHGCLKLLENVSSHLHCRTIILKSEVLKHLNKIHPAVTKRQPHWKQVEAMWENFANILSRYPEGQLKICEYMGVLCALICQSNGLMLEVLRNCSFNSANRPRLLGSAEFLHLLSSILTTDTSLSNQLTICGVLWALGANHHKSKLSLRTAGLTTKLRNSLHRLKYTSDESEETLRAIQIMTYVVKVLSI